MPEPIRDPTWKRNFGTARAFMLGAIDEGWSFNAFYEEAMEAGFSYRRAFMLADWRSVQNIYLHEAQLQGLKPDTEISEHYVTTEMHSVRANYLAGFDYDYFDLVTRTTKTGFLGIMTDKLTTKAELEANAWALIGEGGPYYNPTVSNMRLRYVAGRGK